MGKQHEISGGNVELTASGGVPFIEEASPLTRLHYFDGKFLRADALALEQDYHRTRTRLANLAGGWGVVHGLGIGLVGSRLDVGAGLAITAAGNFVLATAELHATLEELLAVAAPPPPEGSASFADCLDKAAPGVKETAALGIYEITVGPIEGLCGNEPVYGKLCESACVTDSRHPYWREGVVLRLRPVMLQLPASASVPAAAIHLRNRIASAYFRAEPWLMPSAVSAAGLASGVWCQPATLYGRDEVVIGLLAREGGIVRVIDSWSGRRERMDVQVRGYWQGRMAMRPWNVLVAQILQFQCQLSGLFESGSPVIEPGDDCDQLRSVLEKTRKELEGLLKRYGESSKKILLKAEGKPSAKELQLAASDIASSFADIDGIAVTLASAELGKGALPKQRMLLLAGFFDLPPTAFLPIDPQTAVEDQVQRMFGEGVKLHLHAVRHDEIAHLMEQAQHMERISLTLGLDDAARIEQVEVFVPDGEVRGVQSASTGTWWRIAMSTDAVSALFAVAPSRPPPPPPAPAPPVTPAVKTVSAKKAEAKAADTESAPPGVQLRATSRFPELDGLVRTESRDDKTHGFALVAGSDALQDTTGKEGVSRGALALYVSADIAGDPFALPVGGEVAVKAELASMFGRMGNELGFAGTLTVLAQRTLASGREERLVQLSVQSSGSADQPAGATAARMRLLLQRDGDARTGVFLIDDEKHDPQSSPVLLEWDDTPRRAAMYVQAEQDPAVAIGKRLSALRGSEFVASQTFDRASGADMLRLAGAKEGLRAVLGMTGLSAMPEATSTVGAAAMNRLVALADANDDAAFLLRARKRLFPTLDAPKTQTVRAVHDWVMFRRARTHLCGPACDTKPALGVAAIQVWHLKLENLKLLPALTAALDKGDEKALAAFDFRRVGILRYRDESAFAEESADRVLAMWTAAQPAAQVILGRVWETRPTTGQGWQNPFRLRNMLEQIASLTKPPVRGDGALAAIATPSPKLADGALDGGMLVVTAGAVENRNALLIYGGYDSPNHFLKAEFPRSPLQFTNDVPQGSALADFIAGLTAEQPVRGITLATPKAAPDPGATTRLQAVVAALTASGRPTPPAGRQKVLALNAHDRDQLAGIGVTASDYDDVVFFELNAGS